MQQQYVIILAGGTGSRMKSDIPKQFIELQGAPIIIHSLKRFINYNLNIQIIICVHKNYKNHLENIFQKFNLETKNIQIVFGGDTRFQSVKNGLNLIQDLDSKLIQVLRSKGEDYAGEDVLSNFKQVSEAAKALNINVDEPTNYALFMCILKKFLF